MNAGRIETSRRLQDTLAVLERVGMFGATTLDIHNATGSMAVHSDIAALRLNGFTISQQYEGRSAKGARISRYTLIDGGRSA